MKKLAHWSARITLVTTAIASALGMTGIQAFALTEEEVLQKLAPVTVFTVTNAEGAPLVVSVPIEEGEPLEVAGAFMSQGDAEAFVARLQEENPELNDQVQVMPASLAEVYQLDFQFEGEADDIDFIFIPVEEQAQTAQTLLESDQELQGVPMFVARGGEQGGYLTIERDGEQAVPFFFEYEQVQQIANDFQAANPEQADTVEIQVVPLEGVINTLRTQDEPGLESIVLIPSREGLEYLQQLRQQQQP
ncbi:MAG: Tic22 family protein [Cyanobacteria bacterium P01_A01_bin.123]